MSSKIYLIICGNKDLYVAERDLIDMTRERTIADLAAGEWGDINSMRFRVSSIIEIGADKDVTKEFIAAAMLQMDRTPPISGEELAAVRADYKRSLQAAE